MFRYLRKSKHIDVRYLEIYGKVNKWYLMKIVKVLQV